MTFLISRVLFPLLYSIVSVASRGDIQQQTLYLPSKAFIAPSLTPHVWCEKRKRFTYHSAGELIMDGTVHGLKSSTGTARDGPGLDLILISCDVSV